MVFSLSMMVICFFLSYVGFPEYGIETTSVKAIMAGFGIFFYYIARICYDKTITNLKDEIRELREHIKQING